MDVCKLYETYLDQDSCSDKIPQGYTMYPVLPSRIEPGFGYITLYRELLGPAPHLDQPSPYPPDLEGLTGQPRALARAPRVHAYRNPSWTRIPLLLDLLDPIGGRGLWGRYGGCLGWQSSQLESFQDSNQGPTLIGFHGDSNSYIKASIQGLLTQVFGEQRRPSEFILFADAKGLSPTCGKGFDAAKKTSRNKKKAPTRFYRSGSTRQKASRSVDAELLPLLPLIFVLPTKISSFFIERVLDQANTIYEGE